MIDQKIRDKEYEVLRFMREYCKVNQWHMCGVLNSVIEFQFNYCHSLFYYLNNGKLILNNYNELEYDITNDFKKYQRKTKLEKINKYYEQRIIS